ncbi:homeobox protein BEL1 homolog [Malania oleifera]|uniref:homeobox protein BEL1 homolog n=1 Tax=Malania oleifera TaxID=397392 RepID=UPI0025AE4724|nr:homeobox protein BEL1 homolog [Malania oleifera]
MVSPAALCYSDIVSSSNPTIQTHVANQIQTFESNPEDIYRLATCVEMIDFPPQNQQQHSTHHRSTGLIFGKPVSHSTAAPSSSKAINDSASHFYELDQCFTKFEFPTGISKTTSGSMMVPPDSTWITSGHVNPGEQYDERFDSSNSTEELFYQKSAHYFHLRDSKYLGPAQELLSEFCDIAMKQTDPPKQKPLKTKQWGKDEIADARCSSTKQSFYSLDPVDLQNRKEKLLSMLKEVDRRYKHYCDLMKAMASSFEAIAGSGTASVYTALPSRTMSRHFKCLRDAIVDQIRATSKAMEDKDTAAPGTTRGETPRLRILDQTLRQQKAVQQMSIMENNLWRPQRGLPERSVAVLRAWLFEHFLDPYPSDVDKHILARQTSLTRGQVANWFINARVRLWKPMVEGLYLEETKDQGSSTNAGDRRPNQNPKPHPEDTKPALDRLNRIDSDSLSSIINNPSEENKARNSKPLETLQFHSHPQQLLRRSAEPFRGMELNFSSYNQDTAGSVSCANDETGHNQTFGGGAGVSLTLGLQQHGGNGVSLAFSPASQGSIFYPTDHIVDCQPAQFSLFDSEAAQNLPHANFVGAQLLHDLAGEGGN